MGFDTFLVKLGIKDEPGQSWGDETRFGRITENQIRFRARRAMVRFAASEMALGLFESMSDASEHNAFTSLEEKATAVGIKVGMNSLLMGNLAGGGIIGTLVGLTSFIQGIYKELHKEEDKAEALLERLEREVERKTKEINLIVEKSFRLSDEKLKEIGEKIFAREIA